MTNKTYTFRIKAGSTDIVEMKKPKTGIPYKGVQFVSWKEPPTLTRKEGINFIKQWQDGYILYNKSKRRWTKKKVRNYLLEEMVDNLETIELLEEYNLI